MAIIKMHRKLFVLKAVLHKAKCSVSLELNGESDKEEHHLATSARTAVLSKDRAETSERPVKRKMLFSYIIWYLLSTSSSTVT